MLHPHQQEALAAYFAFRQEHPEYFAPRALRRIICDRGLLESYAQEHGTVLGVAAQTPYVYFLVDLVESHGTDGPLIRYPYFRLIYRKQLLGAVNTVVLATIANPALGRLGDVVLIRQERHATGIDHLELPRGFGEVGLSGEQNALQELREETGYLGEQARLLGTTCTDTGVMDARVSFYHVPITCQTEATTGSGETIQGVQLFSRRELWEKIRHGEVTDGFTVQALALYEPYQ